MSTVKNVFSDRGELERLIRDGLDCGILTVADLLYVLRDMHREMADQSAAKAADLATKGDRRVYEKHAADLTNLADALGRWGSEAEDLEAVL